MSLKNKKFCIHKFQYEDSKHRNCEICGLKQEYKVAWFNSVEEKKETSLKMTPVLFTRAHNLFSGDYSFENGAESSSRPQSRQKVILNELVIKYRVFGWNN